MNVANTTENRKVHHDSDGQTRLAIVRRRDRTVDCILALSSQDLFRGALLTGRCPLGSLRSPSSGRLLGPGRTQLRGGRRRSERRRRLGKSRRGVLKPPRHAPMSGCRWRTVEFRRLRDGGALGVTPTHEDEGNRGAALSDALIAVDRLERRPARQCLFVIRLVDRRVAFLSQERSNVSRWRGRNQRARFRGHGNVWQIGRAHV